MRKLCLLALVALVATSCGGSAGTSAGPQARTLRVDFSHDEFSSFFLAYFPRTMNLRPGDTAVFKQTWTGEPHSVTMGTLVDRMMAIANPFVEKFLAGQDLPDEEPPELEEALKPLPWMFDDNGPAQNAAQPCYLDEGTPPAESTQTCAKHPQPAFNGRQTYYNSGFIPYEGPGGNEFKVKLAEDIKPGTYFYYCNFHGPVMSGKVIVGPTGTNIPTQDEVNKGARDEIERMAKPLKRDLEKLKDRAFVPPKEELANLRRLGLLRGSKFQGNLAGFYTDAPGVEGGINDFIPSTIKAKVGEKVSWVVLGQHTISFNVPKYFPIISVKSDGAVEYNPKIEPPAGGAPEPPESNSDEEGGEGGPPKPVVVDAGTWNGNGFYSSGLMGADPYLLYSMRFSRPGKYRYACLVHPPMVGTLEVT
ncbi:MAG: hypothetical protein ACRDJ4_11575 [Actinomycetota bacterium]